MKKRGFPVPDGFHVSNEMRLWALGIGLTDHEIKFETEQFLDRNRAKGELYVDWKAAWRTWMRNSLKYRRDQPRHGAGNPMTLRKLN